MYDLKTISKQSRDGNVNYGYEYEVCFSPLLSLFNLKKKKIK